MKAHVTLVNPPYPSGAPTSLFIPLGIGYLTAVLEKDHEVNVIDCTGLKFTKEQLKAKLAKSKPDIVGVTSATLTYKPALEIVKIAKETCPNCLTVMGGPHVTVLDKETMDEQPKLDVVVRGEGEQTMLELADLASKSNFSRLNDVLGITFRKNGQIVRTPDRPFIQNLDELPHPAFHAFPLEKYRVFGKMYLPIITSRGCPFQCTFCLASQVCGKRFRTRSPKKVVEELIWLRDVHGANAISFYDDTFTYDKKRAYQICEEIIQNNLNLPWDCRTRVDQLSKEMLVKMRDAGCKLIHYGVESGSQKMLDAVKKGTTVEQNAKAIKLTKEIGISVAISVVVGYPGETPEMLQQTMDFIKETKPDFVYVCEAIPYPGTELIDIIKNLGWELSADWNQYDEQSNVFKNPLLPPQKLSEMRGEFYNQFFSPSYWLRKSLKKDIYSQVMARSAMNHLLWRIKIPKLFSKVFRALAPKKSPESN